MGTATSEDHRIIDAVSLALGGEIGRGDDISRLCEQVKATHPAEREIVLAEIAVAFIRWAQDLKGRVREGQAIRYPKTVQQMAALAEAVLGDEPPVRESKLS
jgi:hypothetical protein